MKLKVEPSPEGFYITDEFGLPIRALPYVYSRRSRANQAARRWENRFRSAIKSVDKRRLLSPA